MRLNPGERGAIQAVFAERVVDAKGRLLLYGSRVHDERQGGDVDLALVLRDETDVARLHKEKISLLIALKTQLGDQRIDLSIISEDTAAQDPFYRIALAHALVLAELPLPPTGG